MCACLSLFAFHCGLRVADIHGRRDQSATIMLANMVCISSSGSERRKGRACSLCTPTLQEAASSFQYARKRNAVPSRNGTREKKQEEARPAKRNVGSETGPFGTPRPDMEKGQLIPCSLCIFYDSLCRCVPVMPLFSRGGSVCAGHTCDTF